MGMAEMRREHSEHLARAVHQWDRLYRLDTRFQLDLQRRRAGKDRAGADIFDDDALSLPQRCAAGALAFIDLPPVVEPLLVEAALDPDGQLARDRIEKLDASPVGAGNQQR